MNKNIAVILDLSLGLILCYPRYLSLIIIFFQRILLKKERLIWMRVLPNHHIRIRTILIP